MSDVVSVSPSRLRSLARELKELAEAIAVNEPGIKSGIESWEASVDTRALRALAGWVSEQAGPMLDRAAWAELANNQPAFRPSNDPHPDRVNVPWTITPEMKGGEGLRDAMLLGKLAQSPDPRLRREAALDTSFAIEAHADDPEWLEAFFRNGGAQILSGFPRQMLARDGLPLSKESEEALHWYGVGIAKATSLQEQGKIGLPGNTWDPILHPKNDDMWSSGLLVSRGPKGDQYGPGFLAILADSALDWRDKHQPMRPPYSAVQTTETGWVPAGYVQNDSDWWTSLGINVDYLVTGPKDAADGTAKIRANDPLTFILGRTGENADASRALLSGPKGREHAEQLVDVHWRTPGPVPLDDSGPAASVIRAATFDRKDHSEQSARAALNVFNAGNALYHRDRDDFDREQYPKLPASLAKSLSFVGAIYSDDLGVSSGIADGADGVDEQGWGFHVVTNAQVVNGFLHALMTNPEAAGGLEGAVQAQLTAGACAEAAELEPANRMKQQGRLLGMLNVVGNDMKFDAAEAKDKQNARNKVYFDAVTGIASGLPGLPDLQTLVLVTAVEIGAAHSDALLPDGNADKVTEDSQARTFAKLQEMRLPIAQGLLQSGKLQAPVGRSFYRDGVIKIVTPQDEVEFQSWWATIHKRFSDYESRAQEGFNEVNNATTANDRKHGG